MSTAPQTFTLFSLLPAELRLEIWRESCVARVVEIRYSEQEDRCLTTTKPPTILHVCRESRDEGLRLYVKKFGTKTRPPSIYFSATLDVLYIPRSGSMGYGDTARDFAQYVTETAGLVQSLAIDHVQPEIRRPWETYNKFCLMRNFPLLKEAFLVFSSGSDEKNSPDQDGQIEFVDPRADQNDIMKLMEDVSASFSYEVGCSIRSVTPGLKEEKVEEEYGDCGELRLALIPKTKTVWQRELAVACV